jgi:hypothetical protein
MTPLEFEKHCKALLLNVGWNARTTIGSGDQGADVIADINNRRLVVQCKYYSQPVGNAAVQEVVAARLFYSAHIAAVVSNAPFTKSAQELAKRSSVTLLHHTRLGSWAKQFVVSKQDHVVDVDDLIAVMNALGYVTSPMGNGRFRISMPTGEIRHIGTEGAFVAFAETVRSQSSLDR